MNPWICTKCGHEFPDEQAQRVPDRFSMYGFFIIGAVLLMLGGLGVWGYFWFGTGNMKLIFWGGVLIFISVLAIWYGLKCGKEATQIACPACESTSCIDLNLKPGQEVRKRFAKKRQRDGNQ